MAIASAVCEMVTGSRIGWPERSNSLWDNAPRVASRALNELARTSSDEEAGWNDVNEVFFALISRKLYLGECLIDGAWERWL